MDELDMDEMGMDELDSNRILIMPPQHINGSPLIKTAEKKSLLVESGQLNGNSGSFESVGRRTPAQWFRKYFWEGQKLHGHGEKQKNCPNATFEQKFLSKHQNFVAVLIPFCVAQFIWWTAAVKYNFFSLYSTYWQMPVTMIVGSIIAGMTSEGGGAVAFPVMTFILHTKPHTARDFSIMIQAIGMSMSFFVILFMRIQIEWRAIFFGTAGAIPGAIIGFALLEPLFSPQSEKMLFVSIWSSFALSLWILNREKKRKTFPSIQHFNVWKSLILFLTGLIGGIFTSFAGSGVDICLFSILTLLFNVSEKTATPTTVVLMALNSQFCYYWRAVIMDEAINELAYNYIKVTVPITSICAPIGSFLGSHFHRQTLASLVYILEIVAYVGFLFTKPSLQLVIPSILIIAFGYAFFRSISKCGKRLLQSDGAEMAENAMAKKASEENLEEA
uniref:Sulfite exporter TauE/SafE n=1 Tax=Globodera rostochiensis TaxID=31243 RepID=A0A914HHD6_GLORO